MIILFMDLCRSAYCLQAEVRVGLLLIGLLSAGGFRMSSFECQEVDGIFREEGLWR